MQSHHRINNLNKDELILNNIGGFVFWKDQNFQYLGCNEAFAKVAGAKNSKSIIGKTDLDLPWAEMHESILKVDKNTITTGYELVLFLKLYL